MTTRIGLFNHRDYPNFLNNDLFQQSISKMRDDHFSALAQQYSEAPKGSFVSRVFTYYQKQSPNDLSKCASKTYFRMMKELNAGMDCLLPANLGYKDRLQFDMSVQEINELAFGIEENRDMNLIYFLSSQLKAILEVDPDFAQQLQKILESRESSNKEVVLRINALLDAHVSSLQKWNLVLRDDEYVPSAFFERLPPPKNEPYSWYVGSFVNTVWHGDFATLIRLIRWNCQNDPASIDNELIKALRTRPLETRRHMVREIVKRFSSRADLEYISSLSGITPFMRGVLLNHAFRQGRIDQFQGIIKKGSIAVSEHDNLLDSLDHASNMGNNVDSYYIALKAATIVGDFRRA